MRRHDHDPWHSSIHTNCPPTGTLFAAKQWLRSQHLDKKSHEVSPLSHVQYFKPAPGSAARDPNSSGGDRVVSVARSGCSPPSLCPPASRRCYWLTQLIYLTEASQTVTQELPPWYLLCWIYLRVGLPEPLLSGFSNETSHWIWIWQLCRRIRAICMLIFTVLNSLADLAREAASACLEQCLTDLAALTSKLW